MRSGKGGNIINCKMLSIVFVLVLNGLAGLCVAVEAATPDPVLAGTVRPSAVRDFFPFQLPERYRWLTSYTVFPETAPRVSVSEYPGVARIFYAQSGRFLKPSVLPDAGFLEQQLALIKDRPVPTVPPVKDADVFRYLTGAAEDVGFLRYRVGNTDILLCQTGGVLSNVYVTFLRLPDPDASHDKSAPLVSELLATYFDNSFFGPLALLEQRMANGLTVVFGVDKDDQTTKRFVCLTKEDAATFIIPKHGKGDPPLASEPLSNTWFETDRDRWSSVPLNDAVYLSPFDMRDRRSRRVFNESAVPPKAPSNSAGGDLDEMEKQLKRMSESEARRYCLNESQRLAENPDAQPEKLEFFMRGIGRSFDPPEAKVLCRILRLSKNQRLRATAVRQLSKWITDDADSRRGVLGTITELINIPDRPARQMILLALGESGDPRNLGKICPALDDPDQAIRDAAARAVGILLDWKPIGRTTPEAQDQFVTEAKKRAQPILEKLKALEDSIKQNTPE